MPATSRKRNKGKDRKAKQQAKKEETEKTRIRNLWWGWTVNGCDHGCTVDLSDNHNVLGFMDTLYTNIEREMEVAPNMVDTCQKYRDVITIDSNREMIVKTLTRIGTNLILGDMCQQSLYIASVIVVLEHCDGKRKHNVLANPIVAKKMRDLYPGSSCRRDALKFYRKRTTCKCFKRMHLEARKIIQKKGRCYHCKEERDRELLHVCSRCMVTQFCSRECQVANWPEHKVDCDNYVRAKSLCQSSP